MLRLALFDLARAFRPGAATLARGHAARLAALPSCVRSDFGLGGGAHLARAWERADEQLGERRRQDGERLLSILSGLAVARGFGPLEWDRGDA